MPHLAFSFHKPEPPPPVSLPARKVAFAVGDIHGRADLLDKLLSKIERNAYYAHERPTLIFAGDYIDRGRDSRGVIEILKSDRASNLDKRFLLGNHEQMMLDFLARPRFGRRWLQMGGMDTIASYGLPPPHLNASDGELEHAAQKLHDKIGPKTLEFLNGLERYIEMGGYLFVHAGIDPQKSLAAQKDRDLLWIREPFLTNKRPLSHRVVHGHTPVRTATASPGRIAIDTGAYATGRLTAVRLEKSDAAFLTT